MVYITEHSLSIKTKIFGGMSQTQSCFINSLASPTDLFEYDTWTLTPFSFDAKIPKGRNELTSVALILIVASLPTSKCTLFGSTENAYV